MSRAPTKVPAAKTPAAKAPATKAPATPKPAAAAKAWAAPKPAAPPKAPAAPKPAAAAKASTATGPAAAELAAATFLASGSRPLSFAGGEVNSGRSAEISELALRIARARAGELMDALNVLNGQGSIIGLGTVSDPHAASTMWTKNVSSVYPNESALIHAIRTGLIEGRSPTEATYLLGGGYFIAPASNSTPQNETIKSQDESEPSEISTLVMKAQITDLTLQAREIINSIQKTTSYIDSTCERIQRGL